MMAKDCFIVEDLLPLYSEGLLSAETEKWVKNHLESCSHCSNLEQKTGEPMTEEAIASPIQHEKMMSNITLKLTFYQMIFIGISFFLALKTALLNDSFGFILSYTVLGFVTYLFYKSFKLTIVIAFLPIFAWSLSTTIPISENDLGNSSTHLFTLFSQTLAGSMIIAGIHLGFALIGALIGLLSLKLKESRD